VYLGHIALKTVERRAPLYLVPSLKPYPQSTYLFPASGRAGADRRSAVRFEKADRATVLINGAAVTLVDLSVTGAQVLSSTLLQIGGLVQVVLSMDEEAIRCEAGIVWGTFDILRPTEILGFRAGVDFKGADRRALLELLVSDPRNETASDVMAAIGSREGRAIDQRLACRPRRADRRLRAEVPWLSTIKLPWGLEVQLLNISSSGMLVETGSKFTPGSVTHLHLYGPETDLVIPACFVRSEVAAVDGRGVKYHAAATFTKQLDLDKLARTGSRCVHCGHHTGV
jgi:hypothetical protein